MTTQNMKDIKGLENKEEIYSVLSTKMEAILADKYTLNAAGTG